MGAFYASSLVKFIEASNDSLTGILTKESGIAGFHQQLHTQTRSWDDELVILKKAAKDLINTYPNADNWGILLEYPIARRSKRIDVVLITNSLIFVIEFKSGKKEFLNTDKEQLLDYCLDLRDFHFESRGKTIIPILLASEAKSTKVDYSASPEYVQEMLLANATNLHSTLNATINQLDDITPQLNYINWNNSNYSPTPTIIEAAQTLYSGKSVIEISRSHAGTQNLTYTSEAVVNAIKLAKLNNEKIVCFITGVPGAGKTLAGLNIAHHSDFQTEEGSVATFLSGNGPLIKVLRKALERDAYSRLKKENSDIRTKEVERIIAFIENVHRFIDAYFLEKEKIPNTNIVIFDEAQRAWNAEHSMRKFQRPYSEPEMMFNVMDRHEGWAVIVALVGGGQEINTGEAGLPEWGKVIMEKFDHWKIYISPQLKVGDHSTGDLTLFSETPTNVNITEDKNLHLNVSIRSYKAEKLSEWVSMLLNNNPIEAKKIFDTDLKDYPITLTRNLEHAKQWLKIRCLGSRRMGLVASSGARRLRPYGLDVRAELEEAEWFLNPKTDVRSSYYLEIPATEFGVQGLELDWTGVCWDADLRRNQSSWDFKSFKGTKWLNVSKSENQSYIINKYRVLLTRAREGMILFIPLGDQQDITRPIDVYDDIALYLNSCGIPILTP